MRNLKKFYYIDYFKNIDYTNLGSQSNLNIIAKNNSELCRANSLITIQPNPYVNETFRTKIEYPGLVTGVGIGHEIGVEGEFKLGMHFDHTSGMPIIYGSSVKGVLREYFYEACKEKDAQDIKADIFGSDDDNNSTYSKSNYKRDIFFDAVIVEPNRDKKILAPDSITPHKEGPLKNPLPLTFMKIASGCKLEFRFHLEDSTVNGRIISKEQKLSWFKEILTTYGIGAKTNVGYGQLTSCD